MSSSEANDEFDGFADAPRIDSFFAADHADAINGKLYVMGGGFDTLFVPQVPVAVRFSLAAILVVPWKDTNRRFPVGGVVETIDGEPLGWQMQGEIEAGRAAGKRGGDVQMAVAAPVQFEVSDYTAFVLKLRFAADERKLALQIQPPPFPIMAPPSAPPTSP
jgi:hypothetical protein